MQKPIESDIFVSVVGKQCKKLGRCLFCYKKKVVISVEFTYCCTGTVHSIFMELLCLHIISEFGNAPSLVFSYAH